MEQLSQEITSPATDNSTGLSNGSGSTSNNSTLLSAEGAGISHGAYENLLLLVVVMLIPGVSINSAALRLLHKREAAGVVRKLLIALCACNLTGAVSVTLQHLLVEVVPRPSRALCAVLAQMTNLPPLLTGSITLVMAIERLMAFCAPFWYDSHFRPVTLVYASSGLGLLMFLVNLLPSLGLGIVYSSNDHGDLRCRSFPDTPFSNSAHSIYHVTFACVGLALVVSIVVCNCIAIVALCKMSSRSNREASRRDRDLTRLLVALSLAFLVCWAPINVELLLTLGDIFVSVETKQVTHSIVSLTFVADPILYMVTLRESHRCCASSRRGVICCKKSGRVEDLSMVVSGGQATLGAELPQQSCS